MQKQNDLNSSKTQNSAFTQKWFREKEIPKGNECVQFLLWLSEIQE